LPIFEWAALQEREDTPYEEDVVRNGYSFKSWWRYLQSKEDSEAARRFWLYERALREIPGCYKLWYHYLKERVVALENLPITHPHYLQVTSTFERALAFMHKMPRIWQMYLDFLVHKRRSVTLSRTTFDRALVSLPVTQHDHIWPAYINFVKQPHIPPETTKRVFRRYLKIEPDEAEQYIDFLIQLEQPGEAAILLCKLINDDGFISKQGQTRHDLWMKLCHISSKYPDRVTLRVENIIRAALAKFTHEVGKLWVALADYHARLGHFEKAHDVFEEAIQSVVTVRDFGIIWDAYIEFEYSLIAAQMKKIKAASETETPSETKKKKKKSKSHAMGAIELQAERESLEMRLARYDDLLSRQKILISDVILRQNPHNVAEWHKRISLFDDQPKLQVAEFTSALATVDPLKASGKPQTLWIRFALFWEEHGQITGARQVFSKAVQVKFKAVQQLTAVWTAYVEMELRAADEADGDCSAEQKRARDLIQQATAVPPNYKNVERQIRAEKRSSDSSTSLTPQDKLFKQIKLWSLYADIEESYGTFETAKAVYERMYELKIASPLTVLNYAAFLEEHHRYEDSFRAYERGLDMFPFPHALDIWVMYLTKFLARYEATKTERARDLFEQAVENVPPANARVLYLMYAEFEEKHGMARHTMHIYDRATRAVPDDQKSGVFNLYIRKAAQFFGITKTREVFERSIEVVPDKEVREFCMRYARLETRLGEYDRARAIQTHCAQFCDPRSDTAFWKAWKSFEEAHGNTETFKEMLRIRKSVIATYNSIVNTSVSTQLLARAKELAEADKMSQLERKKDAIDAEDEMEKTSKTKNDKRQLPNFAAAHSASFTAVTSSMEPLQPTLHVAPQNEDEIQLDDEEFESAPIVQTKSVPDAVFGGIRAKAAENDSQGEDASQMGTKKRKRV
jgi:pre-mRNA-splicing factor SYF1